MLRALLPVTLLHLVIRLGPRHHFHGAIIPDEGTIFCFNYSIKVGALSA